ncbi:hypothetical protein ELS19_18460 [Halogeometricum borinquense]|uniref:ABC transporter permease n=2 Tax=Halogeometricum borinquense TaxID=60847 RepID=A0A482SY87_9EURY|nr:hypothetical protein ELS19_18460 [Halogeometricum borinquense]
MYPPQTVLQSVSSRLPLTSKQFWTKVQSPRYWMYGLFLCGLGVAQMLGIGASPNYDPGSEHGFVIIQSNIAYFGSLIAIFVGYASVTSDQASGRIRLLLKLPYARWRYVFEKYLGEGLALGTFTALAILGGLTVSATIYGQPPVLTAVTVPLLSIGYLFVWLSFAVATSVVAKTGRQAITVVISVYLLPMAWTLVTPAVSWLVGDDPALFLFVERLLPMNAYFAATNWAIGVPNSHGPARDVLTKVLTDIPRPTTIIVSELFESVPWFLSGWVSVLVLVMWGLVPMLLACRRFATADIA